MSAYSEDELDRLYGSVASSITRAPETLDLTIYIIASGVVAMLLAYRLHLGRQLR